MESTEDSNKKEDTKGDKLYNYCMVVVYAFAIGINTWIIVDQMTNGELSREASIKLAYLRAGITKRIKTEETFRKWRNHLRFDLSEMESE